MPLTRHLDVSVSMGYKAGRWGLLLFPQLMWMRIAFVLLTPFLLPEILHCPLMGLSQFQSTPKFHLHHHHIDSHLSLSFIFLFAVFPASNIFCHFTHLSWIVRYIDVTINERVFFFLPLPFHSYERNLIPQHSMAPSFDVFWNCFPTAKGFLFCFVQVSQAFLHLELFQNSNGSRGFRLRQLGLYINYCNAS